VRSQGLAGGVSSGAYVVQGGFWSIGAEFELTIGGINGESRRWCSLAAPLPGEMRVAKVGRDSRGEVKVTCWGHLIDPPQTPLPHAALVPVREPQKVGGHALGHRGRALSMVWRCRSLG